MLPPLLEALPCPVAVVVRDGGAVVAANAAWRRAGAAAVPAPAPGDVPCLAALLAGPLGGRLRADGPRNAGTSWEFEVAAHPEDAALALVTRREVPGGRAALLVRAFADRANDMFALSDAETATFVYVNATEARALGYGDGEVVGRMTVPDMAPGWTMEAFRALVARLEAGEVVPTFESGIRRRDGSVLPVEVSVTLVRDGGARYVGAICRDISERLASRAAVRESEARFRTLVEMLPQIVWTADATGRLEWHSPRWSEFTGLPPGSSAEQWQATIHPEDLPATLAAWQGAVTTGMAYETEHRVRRHDGAWRWFISRAHPLRDEDGRVQRWFGGGMDVHELRTAQGALATSEQRLGLTFASAPVGLAIFDRDLRFVMLNERLAAINGIPMAAHLGRSVHEVLPDLAVQVEPQLRALIATGVPAHDIELTGETPAMPGVTRWWVESFDPVLAADGSVTGIIASVLEITERKRAEAALALSEERLARASAAARLGVWEVDTATGLGIVNDEYRRLYGLPPGDAPLDHAEWLARIHPEDRPRVAGVAADAHRGGGAYSEEYRIVRADTGEVRWVTAQGSAVETPGRARRIVGVCYDVTERRQEQERQTLLAREVDHRAKNVLAIVVSILKLTRKDDPTSFARTVEGRVEALARAHTLLSRERWTGSSLQDVVAEELAAYHGSSRVTVQGPPARLSARVVQPVSMVLHELATNAVKYGALSQPGGRLMVSWQVVAEAAGSPAALEIGWLERDGPPIAAPPARRGFGSTLIESTVRGQMRGTVVMHWDAAGLRCAISLPAAAALAADTPLPRAKGEAAKGPLAGQRVLLVEDAPLSALDTAAVLTELGCDVLGPLGSLAEALQAAQGARIDVAVLDAAPPCRVTRPVAEYLAMRGVPVLHLPDRAAPAGDEALAEALRGILTPRGRRIS